jgi:hypothetical protein
MKTGQQTLATQLPVRLTALTAESAVTSMETGAVSRPVVEVLVYSPGPVPCRCGRYLSEDFDGRLFCRGCEGTDLSDITPRLPLCYRAQ